MTTKVLFITKHAVHNTIAMAGHQVFNNTLMSFCQDERFDCAWLTVQKDSDDFRKMKATFGGTSGDFSLLLPKWATLFTYLFYNSFLRVFLSSFRSDWYLLDPFYRFYFKKAIKRAKYARFQPDVIVLEWTEVLFLEQYCRELFPQAKIVCTEHDVTFVKLERKFKRRRDILRKVVVPFRKAELQALTNVDLVRVLSKDDRQTLIDNHIEPDKIRLAAPFFQKKNLEAAQDLKMQVVFYGALNRSENSEAVQWFIEKVFKPFQLSKKVTFVVVGGGNKRLKAEYGSVVGVEFTDYVEQPATIFTASLCMVVPLVNGGGIKIKVLEGMTCSLPVLTNEIGMEGIGGEDGVEYVHCKTPEQYAQAIDALLQRPTLRWSIGNNAREWVNQHFDYEKDLDAYKNELLNLSKLKN